MLLLLMVFLVFDTCTDRRPLHLSSKTSDPNLEREAKQWIEAVTGKSIGPDFAAGLKDGIIL